MEPFLPAAFRALAGQVRHVRRKGAHEWSSTCPRCGGERHTSGDEPDRFVMRDDDDRPRGWCRKCGFLWFAEGLGQSPAPAPALDGADREAASSPEDPLTVRPSVTEALDTLNRTRPWVKWHEELVSHAPRASGPSQPSPGLALWHERGLVQPWLAFYEVGYTPSVRVWANGQANLVAALTLPVWDLGWRVRNVRFRLLHSTGPRYWPLLRGAGNPLFIGNPGLGELRGACLLVEGEIKTMVVVSALGPREDAVIVGTPGVTPSERELLRLKDCEPVWLLFDPDASLPVAGHHETPLERLVRILGRERTRIVDVPAKVDDLLLGGHLSGESLRQLIKEARRT